MTLNHKTIEHTLDNGLKILFQPYQSSSSATFMVWYKVGSRNEKQGKTGISHFLEHISFKNTEFFNKGQIIAEITRNGGVFNAYTSRDFTSYYETFATEKLELAMMIESQRMNQVIFDEDDREKEVGVILSELEKSLDNPYNILEMELRNKAYQHHPYKNPVIGLENDIELITTDDLNSFYNRHYAPNNASIVVVGNFDQKHTLDLIKKYFGNISPKETNDNIPKETQQLHTKRINIKRSGISPIIKLGYHIPPASNKDIFPLIVLGEMLNLGISSRTYQSLVEPQIATDISVNVETAKDPGLFTILATLYPNIKHKEAENRILDEIACITDGKPPTIEELEKTKRRIKSSFEFNRDGTYKLAYMLGYYETVDSYKFVDNYIKNVESVNVDDIRRAADKYLNSSNCSIGHFIPSHSEIKKSTHVYDYIPHETVQHVYKTPPIIMDEKISSVPVKFNKKTLDNGIKVLINENKISNTVKLSGTINAGNLYSAIVNPMLPVICAGMLNRGSKKRSKIEIANEVESRGASVGISNVGEVVNFSLSSTSEDFPFILKILSEILIEPSFPEDELEKFKKFSIAGIRQKRDSTVYLAGLAFSHLVYPKNHIYYAFPLRTQEKQITDISLDDVKEFYNKFYSPNTMILGISGNINSEDTFKLIQDCFGSWQKKNIIEPEIRPVNLQRKYKEKTVYIEGKSESDIVFGHYGNLSRKNPDYHKAVAMNFILGGGGALSSRIGKRIREDLGLVYNISSCFTALLVPGSWTIKYGIDKHYADLSIELLKEEINKFIGSGITESELDLTKSYLMGSYPLRFSNNSGIARALLINEFYDLGDNYINEYPDIINAITKEDIEEMARKYLHPEVASVVKAGNF
ncbi:MAG: pitrilysin family protein [Candidatus Gastranaerophilales bacterium]|nr:pitrilysin family protein [Candidatus Gastranaerophilales bacterium]